MAAEYSFYLAIGALAGFFAGLLGVGGGVIIGPLLIVFFSGVLAFGGDVSAYMAVATASGVIVITAIVSAATHARQKNIDWTLAKYMSAGAAGGAFGGAFVVTFFPGVLLKTMLFFFLAMNAVKMLLPAKKENAAAREKPSGGGENSFRAAVLIPVAGGIGALSAMLGIGGGALIVPYLSKGGVFIRRAIGTSAFIGLPLSFAAAAGFVLRGEQVGSLPPYTWGYVYLPAFFCIALASSGAAYFGARMTNRLPAGLLRKIFGAMLLLVAARLLVTILPAL